MLDGEVKKADELSLRNPPNTDLESHSSGTIRRSILNPEGQNSTDESLKKNEFVKFKRLSTERSVQTFSQPHLFHQDVIQKLQTRVDVVERILNESNSFDIQSA